VRALAVRIRGGAVYVYRLGASGTFADALAYVRVPYWHRDGAVLVELRCAVREGAERLRRDRL